MERATVFDLVKAKNYVVKGKAANALFPIIVGMAPDIYLRGVNAIVEGERIKADYDHDSDIVPRMERVERVIKTMRLANIAAQAGESLDEEADPAKLDANWRERFVSHASMIADEDMHEAWSRILAGEVNRPGSFSIRTIATVADMERHNAKDFSELCQFTWSIVGSHPNVPMLVVVPFGVPNTPLYRGVTFHALKDLESFGLVTCDRPYTTGGRVGGVTIELAHRGDSNTRIFLATADSGYAIPFGDVSFTTTGRELAAIIDVEKPSPDYVDSCLDLWRDNAAQRGYSVQSQESGQG